MSKLTSVQRGFSVVEVVVVVAVLALVGFVGWFAFNRIQNNKAAETTNTNQQVPEVKSDDDLQEAEEFLGDTDVDGMLDTSEIDAALTL